MTALATCTVGTLLDDFAAAQATPAGGSAAALVAGQAAALLSMVIRFSLGRAENAANNDELARYLEESEQIRHSLLVLADRDMEAFDAVLAAYAMPKDTAEATMARRNAVQNALQGATMTPFAIAQHSLSVILMLPSVLEQAKQSVLSDGATALFLAYGALQGALLTVRVNLAAIRNAAFVADWSARADTLEGHVAAAYTAALLSCEAYLPHVS